MLNFRPHQIHISIYNIWCARLFTLWLIVSHIGRFDYGDLHAGGLQAGHGLVDHALVAHLDQATSLYRRTGNYHQAQAVNTPCSS